MQVTAGERVAEQRPADAHRDRTGTQPRLGPGKIDSPRGHGDEVGAASPSANLEGTSTIR